MFGANPIRKLDHTPDDGRLAVQEIFHTIQGEGPFSGQAAIFIRLAGCHLACTFCDTEFESGINNRLSHFEIADKVRALLDESPHTDLVVLTGGEPMRQATADFCRLLLRSTDIEHVQFETAGNFWEEGLRLMVEHGGVSFVCSPKTPRIHPMIARYCKHFKYIIRAGEGAADDGLPEGPTQKNQTHNAKLARPWDCSEWGKDVTVWVSPCDEHEPAATWKNTQEAVQLVLKHGYRLSLQTHKMVGVA